MLSKEHQSKIADLWRLFRSAGISNPLVMLENISYLMILKHDVIKGAEVTGRARKRDGVRSTIQKRRRLWSELVQKPQAERLQFFKEKVFPALIRSQANGPDFPAAMKGAVFSVSKPSIFAQAVDLIDELLHEDSPPGHPGEVYEALLAELYLAGKHDQFRTPRHLVRAMIELVEPMLGEWICDPAAGTGGFLIGAYQWILKELTTTGDVGTDPEGFWHNLNPAPMALAGKRALLDGAHFSAFDIDATMTRIGLTNMLLHGISRPSFQCADMLSDVAPTKRRFDVVISDLPKGALQEPMFVRRCRSLLKAGGRAALVVSEELLFNQAEEFLSLRKELVMANDLEAVVSLPGGMFMPYSAAKTAVLVLNRGKAGEWMNFYDVTADGFTDNDAAKDELRFISQAHRIIAKGNPKREHWISAEAQSFAARQCFRVKHDRIAQHNFTLAGGPYRRETAEASSLQSPRQIVAQIRRLQERFGKSIDKIEQLVSEVPGA